MGKVLKGGKEIAYGLTSKTINYTYAITFLAQDPFSLQVNVQEYLILLQFITFFRYRVFIQIEGLQQPCITQVYQHHFQKHLLTLVSHFGNSHKFSNFFLITRFVTVIYDYDSLVAQG